MTLARQKTFWARKDDATRCWYHVDASGQTLGRLSVKIARVLMGKDKPTYTPGVDMGSYVVVTNARKVHVTGRKKEQKLYRRHTGYIGRLVEEPYQELIARKPERIIQLAVRRMLPKTKLGRTLFGRLKVYADGDHPHQAQSPDALKV